MTDMTKPAVQVNHTIQVKEGSKPLGLITVQGFFADNKVGLVEFIEGLTRFDVHDPAAETTHQLNHDGFLVGYLFIQLTLEEGSGNQAGASIQAFADMLHASYAPEKANAGGGAPATAGTTT